MVRAANPKLTLKIGRIKLREARDVNADMIVTGCPTCELNLLDTMRASKEKMEVLDIAEIAARASGLKP